MHDQTVNPAPTHQRSGLQNIQNIIIQEANKQKFPVWSQESFFYFFQNGF